MLGTNATLLQIRGAGAPDRTGDQTAGATLWSGRASGYLKRRRRTVVSGGQQIRDDQDVFTILVSAGAPVVEVPGPDWEASTILVEDLRTGTPVTRRFTVDAMEHRAAGSVADSVRLELSAESTS